MVKPVANCETLGVNCMSSRLSPYLADVTFFAEAIVVGNWTLQRRTGPDSEDGACCEPFLHLSVQTGAAKVTKTGLCTTSVGQNKTCAEFTTRAVVCNSDMVETRDIIILGSSLSFNCTTACVVNTLHTGTQHVWHDVHSVSSVNSLKWFQCA